MLDLRWWNATDADGNRYRAMPYISTTGIIGIALLVVFALAILVALTTLKNNKTAKVALSAVSILGILTGIILTFYTLIAFDRTTGEYSNLNFSILVTISTFLVIALVGGYILWQIISKKDKSISALVIQGSIATLFLASLSIMLFYALGHTIVPFPSDRTALYDWEIAALNEPRTILAGFLFVPALVMLTITFISVSKALKLQPLVYTTKDITFAGVLLALAIVLSYIGVRMPAGGRITLASSVAIMLYAYFFGFRKGSIMVFAFLAFQFIQGAWIIHPWQMFLDYIIPYSALILFAIFSKNFNDKIFKNKMPVMFFVAALGYILIRYFSHVWSGVMFFYDPAGRPQEFRDMTVVGWAFLYNTFFLIDAAIALVVGVILLLNKPFMIAMTRAVAAGGNQLVLANAHDNNTDGLDMQAPPSEAFDTFVASKTDTLQDTDTREENN